jgi:hypothetical protein
MIVAKSSIYKLANKSYAQSNRQKESIFFDHEQEPVEIWRQHLESVKSAVLCAKTPTCKRITKSQQKEERRARLN